MTLEESRFQRLPVRWKAQTFECVVACEAAAHSSPDMAIDDKCAFIQKEMGDSR